MKTLLDWRGYLAGVGQGEPDCTGHAIECRKFKILQD